MVEGVGVAHTTVQVWDLLGQLDDEEVGVAHTTVQVWDLLVHGVKAIVGLAVS